MKKNNILLFIFIFLTIFISCREELPQISILDPSMGIMGEILTIRGTGFGNDRNESYITIAGTSPTSSSYISWTNNEIIVRTPEFGNSGLVYVHRGRNTSNPAIFGNRHYLPIPVSYTDGNNPRITDIQPSSGPIGTLITIQGNNFGSARGNGGVFFAWESESSLTSDFYSDFIEVSEREFGYEFWSEREIRIRVPDGAVSGNIELRTSRGNSQPVYFEVTGRPGTKVFTNRQNIVINYSAELSVYNASLPNSLFIWMPRPVISSSQRNPFLEHRNIEPFIENYQGTSLYHLMDLPSNSRRTINFSYLVEVYETETTIRSQTSVRLNAPSPVSTYYIHPSPLIPSDDSIIRGRSTEIIARETQLYARARLIYNWLISAVEIEFNENNIVPESSEITTPLMLLHTALEERSMDNYTAALLFTSLARAAGIPAIPVSGVIINRNMQAFNHYWAEFWIDGFGWIPVDPALGAGAVPPEFLLREDHQNYYFGNLDNQRLAFSRGEHVLLQMTPQGRITSYNRMYSLQNMWEEAVGGLDSYSSVWSNVIITGLYIQ